MISGRAKSFNGNTTSGTKFLIRIINIWNIASDLPLINQ
jgi:hypothetical protein